MRISSIVLYCPSAWHSGSVIALINRLGPTAFQPPAFDIQRGFGKGTWAELMKPILDNLTTEDMLNIVAYTASRTP
jgi:hypothetical protein